MRVLAMLHLYCPYHNAGAETTAHQLLKRLIDRGHQVAVQLSRQHEQIGTDPYVYDGVTVWPYRANDDPLRWLMSDEPPQLIIAHLENTLRAAILGDMYKVPVVVLMHNSFEKSRADLRWGAQLVVYNSEWMRADVEDWWGLVQQTPPPPGIVVYPPVLRTVYEVKPPSIDNGHVTLINMTDDKGVEVFYALARRLPKVKFLGVRGAYGRQVIRQDLPNVTIIPHVAPREMAEVVFSKTRVLLMPSAYESYGRVGIEAACSGIPTIAHPTSGLLESLGDGATFIERGDVTAWLDALRRTWSTRGWAVASTSARRVIDRLNVEEDLDRWADAVERVAGLGRVRVTII